MAFPIDLVRRVQTLQWLADQHEILRIPEPDILGRGLLVRRIQARHRRFCVRSVPTGFWRGVGPNNNVFAIERFMDELARKVCPVFGGKVVKVDDSVARKVPGVQKVVVLDDLVAVTSMFGT
jgi:hypothetical protein